MLLSDLYFSCFCKDGKLFLSNLINIKPEKN